MVSSTEDILQRYRLDPSERLAGNGLCDKVVARFDGDSTPRVSRGSMPTAIFVRILYAIMALVAPLGGIGCAGGGSALPHLGGFSSTTQMEWDDLDAAVSYVSAREGLALIEKSTVQDPDGTGELAAVRRYRLIDVHDHPIEIRFVTDSGALDGLRGASSMRDGSVVVRVGRFGDDQRERALVSALLERLEALARID